MLIAPVEKILVKEDPGLYHFINQGCLTVDGMDDKEEMRLVDVCRKQTPQNRVPTVPELHSVSLYAIPEACRPFRPFLVP